MDISINKLIERIALRCLPLDAVFAVLFERYQRRTIDAMHERFGIPHTVSLRYPLYIEGEVSIGDGTYVNPYSEIVAGTNSEVRIGKHCAIGRFVCIRALTHDLLRPTGPDMQFVEKNVLIGDHVWIGTKAFIKEGVNIGDHAVIGANSVVTQDVPPFAVIAGVPARVLSVLDPASHSNGTEVT